ncbi:MAG: cobyrinate a,c-diamide synthase [Rhizobiaceae bacterium]
MPAGLLIAAPQSGSGKTTLTLALLRALTRAGIAVSSAKAGPDFIDPAFHAAASGKPCFNLDPWAMRPQLLMALAGSGSDLLVVEGMMGLYDGGADGKGSAADLANLLGFPVILVVDASRQSHSIAALVSGFRDFRNNIEFAGIVLNRVGSARHDTMLRDALAEIGMPVLASIFKDESLNLPERHLGLVQAREHGDLDAYLDHAASLVEKAFDLDGLIELAKGHSGGSTVERLAPLGQNIAIARDDAFAFLYPHLLQGWWEQGVELSFFSPLADEAPATGCDSVFLPGGYPELHAGSLAACSQFKEGLLSAANRGAFVYGECGGYMVLGEALVDAAGDSHQMAGLLPVTTSFKTRKLSLGYRLARVCSDLPFASTDTVLTGHEFHYSTIKSQQTDTPLFYAHDARGQDLGGCGLRLGNVAGSYLHIVDKR